MRGYFIYVAHACTRICSIYTHVYVCMTIVAIAGYYYLAQVIVLAAFSCLAACTYMM